MTWASCSVAAVARARPSTANRSTISDRSRSSAVSRSRSAAICGTMSFSLRIEPLLPIVRTLLEACQGFRLRASNPF